MWKLAKLTAGVALLSLAFSSSILTPAEAKAPVAKATVRGSCADPGIFIDDGTCRILISAGQVNKNRRVLVQIKNKKKNSWRNVRSAKLNSKGQWSYVLPADCTITSRSCDGVNNYRFFLVRSGKKPQIISNAVSVIFETEAEWEVNPPDPTPPDPTPQNIPNIPSPRLVLSSDGSQIVLTENVWPVGTSLWVTWYKNGQIIPGVTGSGLTLTKDLSNAAVQVSVSAALWGYKSAEVVTPTFSTTVYPLSSKSSVKQILVDGLSWYCTSAPLGIRSSSNWMLITFQAPHTLWTSTWAGPVYLNVSTVNSELVQISSNTTLGTQALSAWGCPSKMQVLVR